MADYPPCPHCGYVDNDMWEYSREGVHNYECPNCGDDFILNVSYWTSYQFKPAPPAADEAEGKGT